MALESPLAPDPPADRWASAGWVACLGLLGWSWWPPVPAALPAPAQWSDVALALALGPWLATRPWRRLPARLVAPAALYVLLALATAAVHGGGTRRLLGTVECVLLLLVTADFAARPDPCRRAARLVCVSMLGLTASALLGAVLFYAGWSTALLGTPGDLVPGPWPRARGVSGHPNLLGSHAIVAFGLAGLLPAGSRLRRLARGAAAAATLLAVSRAALCLVAGVAAGRGSTGRRRVALAVAAAAAGLLLALSVVDLRLDPSRPLAATLGPGPATRWQAATSTAPMVLARPVLGCGLDCIPGTVLGAASEAHLTPLNVAAQRGLPALAVLAVLVAVVVRGGDPHPALRLALVALLLDGLTQDVEDFRHAWVLLGFVAAEHVRRRVLDTSGVLP